MSVFRATQQFDVDFVISSDRSITTVTETLNQDRAIISIERLLE